MSKRAKLAVALALLALVVYGVRSCRQRQTIPVRTAAVQRGTIEDTISTTAAGYLKALREYTATTPLGGRIDKIHRRVGDEVKEGDAIVSLDKGDLENKVRVEQTNLEAARTRAKSMAIKLDGLEVDYQRVYKLWKEDEVFPRSRVEDAYQALEVARGEQKNALAQIEQLESTLVLTRDQVARKDLTAPFDGLLASLPVSEGQNLLPNQPAFSVVDPSSLRVEASVDEVDSPKIHVGQLAYISPDAFPGERFEGTLSSVAPIVTLDRKMSRVVRIEVDLPGQADSLRAGMSVDVEIVVERKEGVPYIPGRAMLERSRQGDFVWTVGPPRWALGPPRAERRLVRLGLQSWNRIEILEGLAEHDRILLPIDDPEKLKRLRPGAMLAVVGEEEEEGATQRPARARAESPEVADLAGAATLGEEAGEGGGASSPGIAVAGEGP